MNNYGPFQDREKLIPNFIKKLANGENVSIYGSGENVREWIHVDDHCDAIELVLLSAHAGEIYNIGSGERLSNLEITKILLNYFSFGIGKIDFIVDRLGHDFRYALNWEKMRNEFGWAPKKNIRESLREIIDLDRK